MLNKNQSRKRNYWKYLFVLPVIAAFLFYFQVKIIAQEKLYPVISSTTESATCTKNSFEMTITKDLTDKELKTIEDKFKNDNGIKFRFSKVRRNKTGEITRIKVSFKDKKGFKKDYFQDNSEAIKPVNFILKFDSAGISDIQFNDDYNQNNRRNYGTSNNNDDNESIKIPSLDSLPLNINISENLNISDIVGTALTSANENLNFENLNFNNAKLTEEEKKKIKAELENARIEIQKAKIEIENAKPEIERARREVERSKPEIERAKREIENSRPEIERASREIERAKREIEKSMRDLNKDVNREVRNSKDTRDLSAEDAKIVRRELEKANKELEKARKQIEKQQAELDKRK